MSERRAELQAAPVLPPPVTINVELVNPHWLTYSLVYLVLGFILVFVFWAWRAEVEVVTTGSAKVIPSSKVQIVQNLEGGILEELLVAEGEIVKRDQVLARISDTTFASNYRESRARQLALRAAIARQQAEVTGAQPSFPSEVAKERPDFVREELALFRARQQELKESLDNFAITLGMVREELKLSEPLVKAGAISEVEILRLRRQEAENKARMDDRRNQFRAAAQGELRQSQVELSRLEESIVAMQDRVRRTTVRSPMDGVVKTLKITTRGAVIQPGSDIMEIVPIEDRLLVETRISPSDVGFLRPGQQAMVKVSAYDFSIYGGLEGKVEHISADTITDARANEVYYLVFVRTEKNSISAGDKNLTVIPGMTAGVDILTDRKTILQYIMKPFLRARETAMRER
jgi:membrane fusion protein, adhesin transport system